MKIKPNPNTHYTKPFQQNCYLSIGSNLKSPERQLRLAIYRIRRLPKTIVLAVAPFYPNEAWGRKTQPNFINTVLHIRTYLTAQQLLFYCQAIEKKQGRIRKTKWGSRTLDIDILTFGNMKQDAPDLIIPHPRMLERPFVMIPLKKLTSQV